jgi:LysR family hydrogen peroxide-inducible transcriptional activator
MTPLPTLRQLRYLTALADHGHFGRAAESCLVTQSTLSAGIRELETLLGAMLAERTKRRVMLTPLGRDIAQRARILLADAEDLVDAVRAAATPLSGPLRLGVIPTIAPYLLPAALSAIRAAHPGLRLSLREDLTGRLVDALLAGLLDVLLLALPWPMEGIDTLEIGDDPFFLALPADHPLAAAAAIESASLPVDNLLLLEEGHCLRQHALAVCQSRRPTGQGLTGTSLHTVVQMVAGGLGLTLLPSMAVHSGTLAGTGLVARPLSDPAAKRTIGLTWRISSQRKAEYRTLAAHFAKALANLQDRS